MLIQNNKVNRNKASNYRPVTCLPLAWKFLPGMIASEKNDFSKNDKLLPEEHKWCWMKLQGKGNTLPRQDASLWSKSKEKEPCYGMNWLLKSIWYSCILLGDGKLKYNGHSKRCSKTRRVELAYTWRGTYKKRNVSRNALLPLPFVMALILLTHILRKGQRGCEFPTGWSQTIFQKRDGLDSLIQTKKHLLEYDLRLRNKPC